MKEKTITFTPEEAEIICTALAWWCDTDESLDLQRYDLACAIYQQLKENI